MSIPRTSISRTSISQVGTATSIAIAALVSAVVSPGVRAAAFPTATAEQSGLDAAALAALDADMERLVTDGRRSGVVYGILRHGRLVVLRAYGLRDVEKNLPMTPDTVFRLYSQTRAVTSAAILTLVDAGKLRLDDPVAKYLPEMGAMRVIRELDGENVIETEPQRSPMTVRELFNFTSGLGYAADWPKGAGIQQRDILDLHGNLADMVTKLARYPLLYQPGARWVYGFHLDVLGRIAEVVSGKPLDAFLDDQLLTRLGLVDTGFYLRHGGPDRLATVYGKDASGKLVPRPAVPSSDYLKRGTFFSGGGGLVSTVPDYLRFGQMLLDGGTLDGVRILEPKTVRAMTTNALTVGQGREVNWYRYLPGDLFRGYGWGLGIGVRLPDVPHAVPGSAGDFAWGGLASTAYFIDPKTDVVAVVMTQYLGADVNDPAFILRRGVYRALGVR